MAVKQLKDIFVAVNYKPCRKKQYEIWACIPPAGTILINKLEQADVLASMRSVCILFKHKEYITAAELAQVQAKSPDMYNWLMQYVQSGKLYQVKPGEVVLSGTRGELWITKAQKVMSQYQVFVNGAWGMNWQAATESRGVKLDGQFLLPWTKIRAKGDNSSNTMACFVPKKLTGQINAGWAVLGFNLPRVQHGNGDFIVCGKRADGKPDIPQDTRAPGNWWVVNGAVFADTYNNQGWTEELAGISTGSAFGVSTPEPAPLFVKPAESETVCNKDLYNFIGQLAQQYASAQHHELAFKVAKGEKTNEILINAKTVVDFAKKNSASPDKITVMGVRTKITVEDDNSVTVVNRLVDMSGNPGDTMFKLVIPNGHQKGMQVDPVAVKKFLQDNATVIFGLCGFVREVGVKGSFKYLDQFTKADYDGMRDYTMTSGATNRYCRAIGQPTGEERSSAVRCIANCDRMFNKVVTSRPLQVFRGEPYEQRVADNGCNFRDITGFVSVNTAYSSTTLNVQSAPMFAKRTSPVNGVVGGIIWAIDIPVGTRAHYVHNVAGWKEQFEILLDRCYDIRAAGEIMSFKDSGGCTYKVVRGELVPHVPGGELNRVQSALLYKSGKTNYGLTGRVDFEKEYSSGVLHAAFNRIRERGFSDVQWQEAFDSDNGVAYDKVNAMSTSDLIGKRINVDSAIVLRVNNPDVGRQNGMVNDLAFVLSPDGQSLVIHRIHAKVSARQNHGDAEDLRWSQYGLGYMRWDTSKDEDWNVTKVNGAEDINQFDQAAYMNTDGRQILHLKSEIDADKVNEIASKIINYAKTHKNICLLPLIDVARYFDTTFTQVIDQEGYELLRSIRVERHYDKSSQSQANDPQAGFVPCKYQITGDNDDHLTIDVKFERDKATGRLKISYRGRSEGTKVNESKALTVDIFDSDKMFKLAQSIIYTFAKRMHLSKARKFDRLVQYFCYQTGCRMVRCQQKDADVLKTYKVWGVDGKSHFMADITKIDVEKFRCCITFDDGNLAFCDFDFQNPIHVLYHQFGQAVVGVSSDVGA